MKPAAFVISRWGPTGLEEVVAEEYEAERQKVSAPVVWMFQPTDYEVVTGERLKEWERDMREQVLASARADITVSTESLITTGTATYCRSGPGDAAYDDCDAD